VVWPIREIIIPTRRTPPIIRILRIPIPTIKFVVALAEDAETTKGQVCHTGL